MASIDSKEEAVFWLRVTRDQLRVLGLAGHFEALMALQEAPAGLTYTELHYGALQRKNTTNIMKALMSEGLADKQGERYVITPAGRSVVPLGRQIVAMPADNSTSTPEESSA